MADITKKIEAMQDELKELKTYKKATQKMLKKLIEYVEENEPKIEQKTSKNDNENFYIELGKIVANFYDLHDEKDIEKYVDIMLNDTGKTYWTSRRKTN